MNRKLKNIILCIIITLLIGGLVGTSLYAKKNIKVDSSSSSIMENNTDLKGMESNNTKNEQNNSSDTSNKNSDESVGASPEKPSGDQGNNTPPEKPSGNTQEGNTSSEKPQGDVNDQKQSSDNNSSSGNESNTNIQNQEQNNNQGATPPSMPNDGMMSQMSNSKIVKLTTPYIVVYSVLSLLLGLSVMYLIMSNLNKKSLNETLSNKDKKIIYSLSSIMLAALLSVGSVFIVNNKVLDSSSESNENVTQKSATYQASKEITSDSNIKNENYKSTTADENAVLVSNSSKVTLNNVTVDKSGDSNGGDNSSFYGTNSAVLAKDGAVLTIKNSTIKTSSDGANGVFSFGGSATTKNSSGDGTTVNISDTKITTTGDNAGGIMTTGGGITNAKNLTISTSGTSSAAIRSDRGGGTVSVDGGTYKTSGKGSPSIYSTADITVKNATLKSTASEGIVIEGANKVTIENTKLTDSNTTLNGQSTTYKNIFLYQSMSGDADNGTASFVAKNSKITTNNGDTFYVTNTKATISLINNTIVNNDKSGNFLRVQKDSWGTSGSNGGDVTLNMNNQDASGNIVVDSISTLKMTLKNKSTFEGAINTDNTAKSIELTLTKNSKIKLTGDTYVTTLNNDDESNSNIDFNGYKLYVNGTSIN